MLIYTYSFKLLSDELVILKTNPFDNIVCMIRDPFLKEIYSILKNKKFILKKFFNGIT